MQPNDRVDVTFAQQRCRPATSGAGHRVGASASACYDRSETERRSSFPVMLAPTPDIGSSTCRDNHPLNWSFAEGELQNVGNNIGGYRLSVDRQPCLSFPARMATSGCV